MRGNSICSAAMLWFVNTFAHTQTHDFFFCFFFSSFCFRLCFGRAYLYQPKYEMKTTEYQYEQSDVDYIIITESLTHTQTLVPALYALTRVSKIPILNSTTAAKFLSRSCTSPMDDFSIFFSTCRIPSMMKFAKSQELAKTYFSFSFNGRWPRFKFKRKKIKIIFSFVRWTATDSENLSQNETVCAPTSINKPKVLETYVYSDTAAMGQEEAAVERKKCQGVCERVTMFFCHERRTPRHKCQTEM